MDLLPSIAPRPGCRKNTGVSAMDSGVAPHLRGAGPIFFRAVPRNSLHVVRWCVWLEVEAASPRCVVPLQAAPNWHAFYFISGDESVKGCGQRRGRGRGKSKGGTCRGCKRRKGCEGNATTVVTPQKNLEWAWIHGAEFRRRRQRLWHHRAKQPRYWLTEKRSRE